MKPTKAGKRMMQGDPFGDWLKEEEAKAPGFTAAVDAGAGRLALAKKLKTLREAAGLTQVELAGKAGLLQPSLARVESGRVMPTLDVVYRIGSALGMVVEVKFTKRRD